MPSVVTEIPAASATEALAHFSRRLAFETDCSDVLHAMSTGNADFVLLDVRSPELYAQGHVPGAVSMPHRTITDENLSAYPPGTLFVVYCAGPHCNGAQRAAVRLARLERPVKEMIGGVTGWLDEGFALDGRPAQGREAAASCGCG